MNSRLLIGIMCSFFTCFAWWGCDDGSSVIHDSIGDESVSENTDDDGIDDGDDLDFAAEDENLPGHFVDDFNDTESDIVEDENDLDDSDPAEDAVPDDQNAPDTGVDESSEPSEDEDADPNTDSESDPNTDSESDPNTDSESDPNTDSESDPNSDSNTPQPQNPPVVETPKETLSIVRSLQNTNISSSGVISLNGKKVLFAGNSQIYHGRCVKKISDKNASADKRIDDKGYFYTLAKNNGEKVTVYNYTIPNGTLDSVLDKIKLGKTKLNVKERETIDYLILSSDAYERTKLNETVNKYVKAFPKSRIFFFAQEYSYYRGYAEREKNRVKNIKDGTKKKIIIADWGEIVWKIYEHRWTVDPSGIKKNDFKRTSFVNNKDNRHPNPLSGYIQALTAYTAITNKSAVGQPYKFTYDTDKALNLLENYRKAYYKNKKDTNFIKILKSAQTIKGIQKLVDKSNGYKAPAVKTCNHQFNSIGKVHLTPASNTYGVGTARCKVCNKDISVEIKTNLPKKSNVMKISKDVIKAANMPNVKQYMLAGLGNVFYQKDEGWGRKGYASIQGMASACDGNRVSAQVTDGTQLYWKIKDTSKHFDANGKDASSGYLSLIGYKFKKPVKVASFALFADTKSASLKGMDILGGVKKGNGYEWTVLWSKDSISYTKYNDTTGFVSGNFNKELTIDAIQIGVKSVKSNILYISEFEVYANK